MVEFPIYRGTEHRERASRGKCSCVGCALSSGIVKFSAWQDYCRVRKAEAPDEPRFTDRFSLAELFLSKDDAPVTSQEGDALAAAMMVSQEIAMEILEAARIAGEKGVRVHEGHRLHLRQLGQRYVQAVTSAGTGRLHFYCSADLKKKAREPALCLDLWDDWFPAAGIVSAAVVDNNVVARWNEAVPLKEMEAFCTSRAEARGPIVRTWVLYHSTEMISLMPHKGSVPVCYAMTRPMVLLSQE